MYIYSTTFNDNFARSNYRIAQIHQEYRNQLIIQHSRKVVIDNLIKKQARIHKSSQLSINYIHIPTSICMRIVLI